MRDSINSSLLDASAEECAAALMEVVPLLMREIRGEMRRRRRADLSVPQFRALAYVHKYPGCSLSSVAEHLGLSLPSASKLIDALVVRALVLRAPAAGDRRRVALELTAGGVALMEAVRQATQARLVEQLAALPPSERATVSRALDILRRAFSEPGPP